LTPAGLFRGLLAVFVVGLGVSITLSESALALLSLLCVWRLRARDARAAARWPLWPPVAAFSVATILSALGSGHPVESLLASKTLLLVAALYVTANALRDTEAADSFLTALSLVVALAALIGLLQVTLCPSGDGAGFSPRWLYHRCDRARGLFSIYMTLAGVLTLVLLATLPRVVPGPAFRRWAPIPWLLSLAALVVTFTRGAWIAFVVGTLAWLPLARRAGWIVVGTVLVLLVALLATPDGVRQRSTTLSEIHQRLVQMADPREAGARERVYMWRSGLAMWRERPLLGVGPGGVKREFPRFALPEAVKKHTSHVHNTALQILAERGLLGLAAWMWIWIAFYVHALRLWWRLPAEAGRERALVAGSLAAITGFLLGGLSEYNFGDSEVVMVAWALMALPWVVEQAPGPRAPTAR
jgi:O-antigen ligase